MFNKSFFTTLPYYRPAVMLVWTLFHSIHILFHIAHRAPFFCFFFFFCSCYWLSVSESAYICLLMCVNKIKSFTSIYFHFPLNPYLFFYFSIFMLFFSSIFKLNSRKTNTCIHTPTLNWHNRNKTQAIPLASLLACLPALVSFRFISFVYREESPFFHGEYDY